MEKALQIGIWLVIVGQLHSFGNALNNLTHEVRFVRRSLRFPCLFNHLAVRRVLGGLSSSFQLFFTISLSVTTERNT